jgi:hypothetical protein
MRPYVLHLGTMGFVNSKIRVAMSLEPFFLKSVRQIREKKLTLPKTRKES